MCVHNAYWNRVVPLACHRGDPRSVSGQSIRDLLCVVILGQAYFGFLQPVVVLHMSDDIIRRGRCDRAT
jgi:hypothetical protein